MNTGFRPFILRIGLSFFIILILNSKGSTQHGYLSGMDIWKLEAEGNLPVEKPSKPWYALYDVTYCCLDLHLERNTVYLEGSVLTQARSNTQGLQVYECELIDALIVDSVIVNNINSAFTHKGDSVLIPLNPAPAYGEMFSVRVFYHGLPPTGGFFSGISTGVSARWGNEVTWTLSQPFNASQWWPCKQDLKDKFDSCEVKITTDAANKAGSNGLLKTVVPLPGNQVRYEWKESYPIDYYLISAAVSRYQEYNVYAHPEGSADSLLIQNYIYDAPGCLEYYKNELDNTKYHLELFSRLFGPYPFSREKYGHCLVNLGGGMEHQTMGSLGDFNFHLTSHELAHQWFGDHVTCASWSDIWLNEGFATYAQYLSLQYLASQAYADTLMMGIHNYVKSKPGGSVYIPPDEAVNSARIFDGRLSYNKGAAIIQSLRGEINNDLLFFQVLQQFMILNGDSVATAEDFQSVAETVTGLNFSDFFRQWYYGEGYPVLNILYWQDKDSLRIYISQKSSTTVTPLFKMHLECKIKKNTGDTLIRVFLDDRENTFTIPLSGTVQELIPDPGYRNILNINTITQIKPASDPAFIQLFPNPCRSVLEYFIATTDPGPYKMVLYDMNGKKVSAFLTESRTGSINIEGIESGIYLLEFSGIHFQAYQKIIKQ